MKGRFGEHIDFSVGNVEFEMFVLQDLQLQKSGLG